LARVGTVVAEGVPAKLHQSWHLPSTVRYESAEQGGCNGGIEHCCCPRLNAGVARPVASREGLGLFIDELPLDGRAPYRNPGKVLDALLPSIGGFSNSNRIGYVAR